MVKTHLSLSHDPDIKGRPRNWKLPIRDFLVYKGAGFIVPLAGQIKLMPGTEFGPGFPAHRCGLKNRKSNGNVLKRINRRERKDRGVYFYYFFSLRSQRALR